MSAADIEALTPIAARTLAASVARFGPEKGAKVFLDLMLAAYDDIQKEAGR